MRRSSRRRTLWGLEDKNGVLIIQELIAKAGTEFLEYYYDNPDDVDPDRSGRRGKRSASICGHYRHTRRQAAELWPGWWTSSGTYGWTGRTTRCRSDTPTGRRG